MNQWWRRSPPLVKLLVVVIPMLFLLSLIANAVQLSNNHDLQNRLTSLTYTPTPNSCEKCVSDGSFIFDNRSDLFGDPNRDINHQVENAFSLKKQGADQLFQKHPDKAVGYFQQALALDANDAETHIALQNALILQSGQSESYITVVIAIPFSGDSASIGMGRDDLQGAALVQEEINTSGCMLPQGSACLKLRLLIADIGKDAINASQVAQQIVRLSQDANQHLIGVMGWPISTENAIEGIRILASKGIPMISPKASSDELTGISPYFFRVAPPDTEQGKDAAQFVDNVLHRHTVALFLDENIPYSRTLASSFYDQFTESSNNTVFLESYNRGKFGELPKLINNALQHNPLPDAIYFAGYSEDFDVLRTTLLSDSKATHLLVMGGDALYDLNGYRGGYKHIYFTTFAFPDTWDNLGLHSSRPMFFDKYPAAYGKTWSGKGSPYGYVRADDNSILSYDALNTLMQACHIALNSSQDLTRDDVQQGLMQIKGADTYQGVSGQIKLGLSGNPIDKQVVVLCVDDNGNTHQVGTYGQFLIGGSVDPPNFSLGSCSNKQ